MIFGSPDYWNWKQKMAETEPPPEPETMEFDSVTGWRFGWLVGLGFDPESALRLAESKEVELSKADYLVRKKGCPHETAMRILL